MRCSRPAASLGAKIKSKVIDAEAGASPSFFQTEGMILGACRVRPPAAGAELTSEVESDRKKSQDRRAIGKDVKDSERLARCWEGFVR